MSILLFQDLAVVPLLITLPALTADAQTRIEEEDVVVLLGTDENLAAAEMKLIQG